MRKAFYTFTFLLTVIMAVIYMKSGEQLLPYWLLLTYIGGREAEDLIEVYNA